MKRKEKVTIQPLGDMALVLSFAKQASQEVHEKVMLLLEEIEKDPFTGLIEVVPTYTNITVFYDPLIIRQEASFTHTAYETVHKLMFTYMEKIDRQQAIEGRTIEIPVLYGGKYGPDLTYLAERNGMTEEELVAIHSAPSYLVYMIGFAPGFPFLGGMDERIAAPRKETPRQMIPAGSVGIAGTQTGVYPIETPGGWQIIGQTPRNLFLRENDIPSLLQSGDRLKFIPMTEEAFEKYEREEGVARWQLK